MSKWFAKFRAGDFLLDNVPQSGRSVEVDSDQMETLTENNQRYTTRNIADILKISKSSVENHLHQLGYVNHFDVWVPRKLSENNLLNRISACDSLLKHNENVPFLKQIVTGDEKWVLYNHAERKRTWGKRNEPPPTTPKASLHPKKVMLCIWWDWKGVLYHELLPENQTINSNKYCFHPIRPTESSIRRKASRISQQKMHNLPSGLCKTSCFFDDWAKTVSACLGSSDSSAIFTRQCTFGFPFILVFTKFS